MIVDHTRTRTLQVNPEYFPLYTPRIGSLYRRAGMDVSPHTDTVYRVASDLRGPRRAPYTRPLRRCKVYVYRPHSRTASASVQYPGPNSKGYFRSECLVSYYRRLSVCECHRYKSSEFNHHRNLKSTPTQECFQWPSDHAVSQWNRLSRPSFINTYPRSAFVRIHHGLATLTNDSRNHSTLILLSLDYTYPHQRHGVWYVRTSGLK